MKQIKKVRFDALAGYIREPLSQEIGQEVGWYEKENVLGVIFFDYPDKKYNVVVLGQDECLRFRCVDISTNFSQKYLAEREIEKKLDYWARQPRDDFFQGDKGEKGLDFFHLKFTEEKLDKYFKLLAFDKSYLPAKELISYLMRYYQTNDVGFVNQFQSNGFHSRIWELYLYAMLSEANFSFLEESATDFLCQNSIGKVAIEATAMNPDSSYVNLNPGSEEWKKLSQNTDATCIRIDKSLVRKLKKRYWEKIGDAPLVVAIQDFHYPMSSQILVPPLMNYLYGERLIKDNGLVKMVDIGNHKWRNRTIKSNFGYKKNKGHFSRN